MMGDLATFHGALTDLDGANPTRFRKTRRNDRLRPCVLSAGLLQVWCGANDEIWFALAEKGSEIPALFGRPLDRGGHVLWIAFRRAAVDPTDDRVDLFVSQ